MKNVSWFSRLFHSHLLQCSWACWWPCYFWLTACIARRTESGGACSSARRSGVGSKWIRDPSEHRCRRPFFRSSRQRRHVRHARQSAQRTARAGRDLRYARAARQQESAGRRSQGVQQWIRRRPRQLRENGFFQAKVLTSSPERSAATAGTSITICWAIRVSLIGYSIPISGSTDSVRLAAGQSVAVHVQHRAPHDRHQPDPVSAIEVFTFRFAYSKNIFQGPSLTPSGDAVGGQEVILQEYQRNSTDDYTAAVDWKPIKGPS